MSNDERSSPRISADSFPDAPSPRETEKFAARTSMFPWRERRSRSASRAEQPRPVSSNVPAATLLILEKSGCASSSAKFPRIVPENSNDSAPANRTSASPTAISHPRGDFARRFFAWTRSGNASPRAHCASVSTGGNDAPISSAEQEKSSSRAPSASSSANPSQEKSRKDGSPAKSPPAPLCRAKNFFRRTRRPSGNFRDAELAEISSEKRTPKLSFPNSASIPRSRSARSSKLCWTNGRLSATASVPATIARTTKTAAAAKKIMRAVLPPLFFFSTGTPPLLSEIKVPSEFFRKFCRLSRFSTRVADTARLPADSSPLRD